MINIHATCFQINKKGILLLGKSGSGKSDLCLRAIMNKNAKLVADDRVDINKGCASAPKNLAGLLEVRGIGIVKFPYLKKVKISLVVELSSNIERLPETEFYELENLKIKKIKINPFEESALDKLIVACK